MRALLLVLVVACGGEQHAAAPPPDAAPGSAGTRCDDAHACAPGLACCMPCGAAECPEVCIAGTSCPAYP